MAEDERAPPALLTLVFGHLDPFAASNRMFELRQGDQDALFEQTRDGGGGKARAIVVAPNLIPQSITPANQKREDDRSGGAAGETWSEGVQVIHRDFSTTKTLAEPWFHKDRSYFTSTRSSSQAKEAFQDSIRYFLESMDRFGGVHLLLDDLHFIEAAGALEDIADETCGTLLLREKSICYSWHGGSRVNARFPTPQSLCTLAPLVATYVPMPTPSPTAYADAIHILSLPYRARTAGKLVSFAQHYHPLASFPSDVSVSMLHTWLGEEPAYGLPVWSSVMNRLADRTAVLNVGQESTRWLMEQRKAMEDREARDYSIQRCGLEADEHGEMLNHLTSWEEEYASEI